MAPGSKKKKKNDLKGSPVDKLTDDILTDIISRVPYKSTCCCKCVSTRWRDLFSHPDHRKKLPQPLVGFLYESYSRDRVPKIARYFTNVSGKGDPLVDPSLSFLPKYESLHILDCCNGLLLCRWYGVSAQVGEHRYVVCNPATEKWVALPDSGQATGDVLITRLCFDPAQSLHFHVFELLEDLDSWGPSPGLAGVAVYSSEAGRWVHKKERWSQHIRLPRHSAETVFLKSHLYFHAIGSGLSKCVAAVDTEGETWTNFGVPGGGLIEGFIQQSQGCLQYANFYGDEDNAMVRLAVYVLEDYESKEWILKHVVETSYLFGGIDVTLDWDFEWVGIHPECNLIFFTAGWDTTFMCYNMDHRQVKVIRNLKVVKPPYLPYVPLYAELQSLHM